MKRRRSSFGNVPEGWDQYRYERYHGLTPERDQAEVDRKADEEVKRHEENCCFEEEARTDQ